MTIANLEHRLAFLHDRQLMLAKQSDILKRAAWIAIPIVAVVVMWIAFRTQQDSIPMLVLFSILIAASATMAWTFRHSDWSVDLNHFAARNRYTSYRVLLEESIRECEKALAELKAKP
jgi:hypothetical protein